MTEPGTFYQVGATVLNAVVAALSTGPTDVPVRIGIVPGEIAWDADPACGQLALALTRSYFSMDFPADAAGSPQSNCAASWFVGDYTVQLIRCAPTPDARGNGPSMKQLDAAAQTLMADAWVVLGAITGVLCMLTVDNVIIDYVVKQQQVVGPNGALCGSQVEFSVAVQR